MLSKIMQVVVTGGVIGGASYLGYTLYERGRIVPSNVMATPELSLPRQQWDYNWDRRDPAFLLMSSKDSQSYSSETYAEELKKLTPKASRHILLIRHGHFNKDKEDDDSVQGLTELGREQATLTGLRLQQLDHPYTGITSSTKARARETADVIHKHLPHLTVVHSDLLCEGAPVPSEPPSGNWRTPDRFYTEGARVEGAFRKFFHRADPKQMKDSFEVLVCHANVIRYFVCRALQFPAEGYQRLRLHHASITWICILPSGRVALGTLSSIGHIPWDKVTSNRGFEKLMPPS